MASQYLTVLGVHSISPQLLKSNPHEKNKKVKYIMRAGIGSLLLFYVLFVYTV